MSFTAVNGVTLHHQIAAGSGRPVVFSNSLGTDFRIWDAVRAALPGAPTVCYDKRGHGLSDLGDGITMDAHVADLAALLDHLGVRDAVICGLSVGGLIAQGLVQARPDLVAGLILCDTGHRIGTHQMWDTRVGAIRAGGIESLADAILERWFSPSFRRDRAEDLAGYRNMLVRTPAEGYTGTCLAIRDTDYTDAARRIAVPTLCVVGSEDQSTPPDLMRETTALIPGAVLEVIDGPGHLPCIETPDILAGLIREFREGLA